MKTFLYSIVIFSTQIFFNQAYALNFDVIGPCSDKAVYSGIFKADIAQNIGVISMDIFNMYKIPYSGSEEGMRSIINTPVGDDAIEVLSDTKMRAYGWCFSINGFIPDKLSSQSFLTKQNDYISWFFAFSTYDQGIWTDYCVAAHTIKSAQFCK